LDDDDSLSAASSYSLSKWSFASVAAVALWNGQRA
jgi:hypothetical protein